MDSTSAYGLLKALKRTGLRFLLDEFDAVGGDDKDLDRLLTRVKRASERGYDLGFQYAFLFSWLVARVGPRLGVSCEFFEADVAQEGNPAAPLVMPRWVLSSPTKNALQRRLPCNPFVDGDDQDLVRAYRGLLDHLVLAASLSSERESVELLSSAIPWRIVALADGLEKESYFGEPIATRLQKLRYRTIGPTSPAIEKHWWRALDGTLCIRRHVLSHLSPRDGWSFSRCVDSCWTLNDAREAAAGIGLALMQDIALYLRNIEPAAKMLEDVMGDHETAWLDEQGEEP